MGLHVGEVESELFFERGDEEEIVLGLSDVPDVHAEQTDLLGLGLLLVFLVVLEESLGSLNDFALIDTPEVLQIVDDGRFFVEGLQHLLVCHVIETQDAVTDSRGLEDLDPSNFGSVVAVGSAAGLHVDSFDIHHTDLVARDDTSLIEIESVLGLCLLLALEVLSNGVTLEDDAVGLVLDLHFHLLTDGGVVGDIQMGVVFSLLRTVLPDVRTQDASSSCVDNVSSSVEGTQGVSSLNVDLSLHCLPDCSLFDFMVEVMQEALAHFLDIVDLVVSVAEEESTQIVHLPSRGRVEGAAIQNDDVLSLFLLLHILEHCNNLAFELG